MMVAVLLALFLLAFPRTAGAQDYPEVPGEEEIERTVAEYERGDVHVYRYWKVHDPGLKGDYRLILMTYEEWGTKEPMPKWIRADILEYAPSYGKFVFSGFGNEIYAVDSGYFTSDNRDAEFSRVANIVRTYIREHGLAEGWPQPEERPGDETGDDGTAEEGQDQGPGAKEGSQEGKEGAVGGARGIGPLPGPGSWPQAVTGILLPGLLGLVISLLSSLFGTTTPPTAPPREFPSSTPQLDDLTLEARHFIAVQRNHTQYWSDPAYRALVDRMETECFGPDGRVDWERFCDLRFGELSAAKRAYLARDDYLLLSAREFAREAGRSIREAGIALKDGVIDLSKGLISIPCTVYHGYKELLGLFADEYRELVKDFLKPDRYRWSLLQDILSPEIGLETAKGLYHTLGEELLPIMEIERLLARDSTLEERLWAIPSGAVKIANLIMLSPRIAGSTVPAITRDASLMHPTTGASRAVEAARAASVSAEAQAEYEAYKAAAAERAARIQEAVEQAGRLDKQQVLDAMGDPATMRVLKEAPPEVRKKFFYTQAREIYSPVYRDVIKYMEAKNPGAEYRIKSIRTPGQGNLINTDNDVVLQVKVITREGKAYWKEVPVKEWEGAYNEAFSRHTGFSPEKAKAAFPEEKWDAMSPERQRKVWTEKFGQETMDVKQPEAAHAFSDQPTAMDPSWRPGGKSPVAEGRVVDQPGLGMMEYYKTTKGYRGGTVQAQTEAMEQGIKAGKLCKRLAAQAQKRTGYGYSFPRIFDQGLEVLGMRELAPAVRDLALKNLGFKGGYEEFMYRLSNWMGGLR